MNNVEFRSLVLTTTLLINLWATRASDVTANALSDFMVDIALGHPREGYFVNGEEFFKAAFAITISVPVACLEPIIDLFRELHVLATEHCLQLFHFDEAIIILVMVMKYFELLFRPLDRRVKIFCYSIITTYELHYTQNYLHFEKFFKADFFITIRVHPLENVIDIVRELFSMFIHDSGLQLIHLDEAVSIFIIVDTK